MVYVSFVTGLGDGFSVDLIKGFCRELGVRYKYVRTTWDTVIQDLVGKKIEVIGNDVNVLGPAPVRGDVIANGLTKLPWREHLIAFSDPVFPTQVWLMAPANSSFKPIESTGSVEKDIEAVKAQLKGKTVLGKRGTCIDGALYGIEEAGATFIHYDGNLNELIPLVLSGKADATLLDESDALVGLVKWPGEIKVIGPVSPIQVMGVGFTKNATKLKMRFNEYLKEIKRDGRYMKLIKKYYPLAPVYFPDFFKDVKGLDKK